MRKKPTANVLAFFGVACIASILAYMTFLCLAIVPYMRHVFRPFMAVFMALRGLFWRGVLWSFAACLRFLVFTPYRKTECAVCRQNCVLWRFMALHVYIYVYAVLARSMPVFVAYGVR